jgi:hypothetical protein
MADVSGWIGFNQDVVERGMQMFLRQNVKPAIISKLTEVANEMVQYIDSGVIPEWTANLHDATGVAVYTDGRIASYIPTKRATTNQRYGTQGFNWTNIDGTLFLTNAISEAASMFSSGIWIVVFSAVPYAYRVNEVGSPRHRGQYFFEYTKDELTTKILSKLQVVKTDDIWF